MALDSETNIAAYEAPKKNLYELGEMPPLGHVPKTMYAWTIRRERHGDGGDDPHTDKTKRVDNRCSGELAGRSNVEHDAVEPGEGAASRARLEVVGNVGEAGREDDKRTTEHAHRGPRGEDKAPIKL